MKNPVEISVEGKQDCASIVCITPPFFFLTLWFVSDVLAFQLSFLWEAADPGCRKRNLLHNSVVGSICCCFAFAKIMPLVLDFRWGTYAHHVKHISITWISVKILLWKSLYSLFFINSVFFPYLGRLKCLSGYEPLSVQPPWTLIYLSGLVTMVTDSHHITLSHWNGLTHFPETSCPSHCKEAHSRMHPPGMGCSSDF